MNRLSINFLTNALLLLVGVALIVFYSQTDVLRWVAVAMGLLFVVPSLAFLATVAARHADARQRTDYLGVVPAVGGMCFGVVMVLKPHLFEPVIVLLLGVLLAALGVFHLVYLLLSRRVVDVPAWYFMAPLLVVGAGAAVLCSPELREQHPGTVTLLTGVGLLLFNLTSLQEYYAERRLRREPTDNVQASAQASDDGAADVVL